MKKISLGCPNQECKAHKKNVKYKDGTISCPKCGSELVHVCKNKKCRTVVEDSKQTHCVLCRADKSDNVAKVGKTVLGAGGATAIIGVVVENRHAILDAAKRVVKK